MSKEIKKEEVVAEEKFFKFQILRLPQYNNRTVRLILDSEKQYSLKEVDKLIAEFMGK